MSDIKSVTMTDELAKAVSAALDPADIRAAILAEAEKQGVAAETLAADQAAAEKAAADKLAADNAASANVPAVFTRTEIIGGKEFKFEGASQNEVDNLALNAYKIAYAVQPTPERVETVAVDPAIAAAEAQRIADENAAAQAELELKFKRGEISTADYLEQSGAMDTYLAKKGIPLASIKQAVEQNEAVAFKQSWVDATEQFKNSPAGSDWPGGEQNTNLLRMKLAEMGLIDAEDKAAAIAAAYADMKAKNMVYPVERAATPLSPAEQAIAEATAAAAQIAADKAAAAEALRLASVRQPSKSSSIFGASSGIGAPAAASASAATQVDIPKEASPEEIIAAWKQSVVASGQNPDDTFKSQFSARRI